MGRLTSAGIGYIIGMSIAQLLALLNPMVKLSRNTLLISTTLILIASIIILIDRLYEVVRQ